MLERLINVAVSALFGAFLLAFGILVWSAASCEPPNKEQNERAQNSANKISCEAFNVGFFKRVGIIVADHPNETAASATAVATFVIAWFTVVLSRIGRRQSEDARIIERAYINVVEPRSEIRIDPQGNLVSLRVWVLWKNAGRTPAFPMFARVGATFQLHIEDFRFGEPPAAVTDPMALGPTAEFSSGHIDISAGHVFTAASGQGHQFMWGEARYHDTFPGSPRHVLEFCYKLEIALGHPLTLSQIRFNLYGDHNRYYDEPAE